MEILFLLLTAPLLQVSSSSPYSCNVFPHVQTRLQLQFHRSPGSYLMADVFRFSSYFSVLRGKSIFQYKVFSLFFLWRSAWHVIHSKLSDL